MVNKKLILFVIGALLVLEAIGLLTAVPFSLYYGGDDLWVLLGSAIGIGGLGGLLFYYGRPDGSPDLNKRDGYLIVTLGWVSMAAFGAIPFVIHGSIPSYTDAFFETMSGFTTTGASILNNIEEMPHGLLYWRSLTQWLGGMGFIVLSLAILPILGIGGMQLFVAEVPGPTKDKIHPRIKETAKRLWGVYLALTILECTLLMAAGMNFFDAVNHSFTTMATGGFSTKQASIGAFESPYIHYIITFFMFAAGVNFTLHYLTLRGDYKALLRNEEFHAFLRATIFITIAVTAIHISHQGIGFEQSFRESLFHVVSLTTTTGYVTADYENWAPFANMVFFILLFVGGSAGSTGGGIKIVRHVLLFKNSFLELKRLIHPRAVIPVRFNGLAVKQEIINNVLAFFLFYVFLFAAGSIIISLLDVDFLTSASAVATCIGNVGPGFGDVGPVKNFATMPGTAKWVLSFFMLVGRLELFTVLVIFSRSFWKT